MGRCHEEKKHCKKCVETQVIRCLPYHIQKSGHYCLGKDFEWADVSRSAITITADNVVLDFNQKTITSKVASSYPLVRAYGANDLVLNNIHLETEKAAEYSIDGIDVRDSASVTVNSPRLINLQVGFYTENVKGLEVHHLYLENEDAGSQPSISVLIYLSDDIKFYDSVVENGRTYFGNPLNADIQRLQAHNRSGRALQFASVAVVNKGFPPSIYNIPPPRTTTGVKVSGCELISDNTLALFAFGAQVGDFGGLIKFEYTNKEFIIENNIIQGGTPILLQDFFSGALIKCNQITLTGADVTAAIVILGKGVRVQDNNIYSVHANPFIVGVSGNIGILTQGRDGVDTKYGYNFIDNNSVTGASLGFNDGGILEEGSFCNIFRDNMATGNIKNYDFVLTLGTVDNNNIRGCTLPEPEPMVLSAERSSESVKKSYRHEN